MPATVKVGDGFKKTLDRVMAKKDVDSVVASDMIAKTYVGRMNAIHKWVKTHPNYKPPKARKPKATKKVRAKKTAKKAAPKAQAPAPTATAAA